MAGMETWNEGLFLRINASTNVGPVAFVVAVILANYAVLLVPLVLAALWLRGKADQRAGLLLSFVAAEVALGFGQVVAAVRYHPRPFAIPLGRKLIEHAADSSFPSDHATFIIATGLGLWIWTTHRGAAVFVLCLAVPVAWARIFLGVHFPLDMAGAVPVAAAGLFTVRPLRPWTVAILMPRVIDPIYRMAFLLLIRKGWVLTHRTMRPRDPVVP